MKAISIKQPWASLIAHGIKDIENRTWPCPKKYIGQRVLIHASATSWTWHRVINYFTKPMRDVFIKMGYNGAWLRGLPTGSIIGSVQIVDCVINHPSIWAEKSMECKCPCCGKEIKRHFNEDYFFCEHCDRKCIKGLHYDAPTYNWVLANPILFSEPIPAKGKLSFWESELTEEQINNLHHAKN